MRGDFGELIVPRSIAYRPELIDQLITTDRINSYQSVFRTTGDLHLMGTYLWNSHVCGAFYPIINAAEVALRNSVDLALTNHLGYFWWDKTRLAYKSHMPGVTPPEPVQIVREGFAKATTKIIRMNDKRFGKGVRSPRHPDIVAATDFSTWQFIFDAEFMGNGLIWPSQLGQVFRGPLPYRSQKRARVHAFDLVGSVRNFRNRVFHHEPAWKHGTVANEEDAMAYLLGRLSKLIELITLVHPEKARLLEKHGLLQTARRACTIDELRRFQLADSELRLKSVAKLSKLTDQCAAANQARRVKLYSGRSRRFLMVPVGY